MITFNVAVTVPDDFYMGDRAGIENAICETMAELNADENDRSGKYSAVVSEWATNINTITGNTMGSVVQCGTVHGGVQMGGQK